MATRAWKRDPIASPRVGWQTSVGPTALSLWTGANYLHLSQHQYGKIAFDILGRGPTDIAFDLDIREVGAWNAALGGRATLATPFEIKGVNYSISSACATSSHCIGNAYEHIQSGRQDVMFAGGG